MTIVSYWRVLFWDGKKIGDGSYILLVFVVIKLVIVIRYKSTIAYLSCMMMGRN